jgi:fucose permease
MACKHWGFSPGGIGPLDHNGLDQGLPMHRRVPVYLAFAATGVALTQVGALLPVLLRRWSLSDAQGGLLLFSFYLASAFGPLLVRGHLRFALMRAALVTSAGALGMALSSRITIFPAVALYGLGLGGSIAGLSLLQSRRLPNSRRLELTRMNLLWAIGAACGPWLALHATHDAPIVHAQHVLFGIALYFAAAALWAWGLGPTQSPTPAAVPNRTSRLPIPLALLLLTFSATGVDAATGGWLTAYAQRAGDTLGITIGAATCLWIGSFLSRLLHSTPLASRWSERSVLRFGCCSMAAALLLLVAWPNGLVTMLAAALLGFAAGPVYPLLLAMALGDREDARIFIVGGLGASALPLLTGQLSSLTHSLRAGLGTPLLAAMLMAAIALGLDRTRPTNASGGSKQL